MAKDDAKAVEGELLDLIPPLKPLPWEDPEACKALEEASIWQLGPQTIHERAIARDVADCLWQIIRVHDLNRCIAVLGYRQAVAGLIDQGMTGLLAITPGRELGMRLTNPDQRADALAELDAHQIDDDDIRAKAFIDTFQENEALHRRAIQLEERRRRLMAEYNELLRVAESRTLDNDDISLTDAN